MIAVSRILQNCSKLLFDPKYSDIITNTIKSKSGSGSSIFSGLGGNIRDAFVAAEKGTSNTPLWQGMKNSITSFPQDISVGWKGAASLGGKLKSFCGQFGKRIPLIGSVIMVLFELPNIIEATKDKGLIAGALETVKAGGRLAVGMTCAAIGQALCPVPIAGSILGWMAGDWIYSKIFGKSYKEQKDEKTSAVKEMQAQTQEYYRGMANPQLVYNTAQQLPTNGLSSEQLLKLQQALYSSGGAYNDDVMYNRRFNTLG